MEVEALGRGSWALFLAHEGGEDMNKGVAENESPSTNKMPAIRRSHDLLKPGEGRRNN